MSLSSYGNQINLVLLDLKAYLITQIGTDVNIYVGWPQQEVRDNKYPLVLLNDMGASSLEFVGERLNSGKGEWHTMRLQCDILTKRGRTVDTLGGDSLLRKIQITLEEIFRDIDGDINTIFTSVPVVRLIAGDFLPLSWLEAEGIFRKGCEIVVIFEHVRS